MAKCYSMLRSQSIMAPFPGQVTRAGKYLRINIEIIKYGSFDLCYS